MLILRPLLRPCILRASQHWMPKFLRLLLNRLNLLSEPWQPSPKVKPQPLRSAKASPAISRWLVGMSSPVSAQNVPMHRRASAPLCPQENQTYKNISAVLTKSLFYSTVQGDLTKGRTSRRLKDRIRLSLCRLPHTKQNADERRAPRLRQNRP